MNALRALVRRLAHALSAGPAGRSSPARVRLDLGRLEAREVPAASAAAAVRSIDGSGNNLAHPA